MALYWPDEKVALDIVDDPHRRPFEGDDSYTVLRVTCADLCDYDSYSKVMRHLCALLGKEVPSFRGWEEANRALHALLSQDASDDAQAACYPFPDFFAYDEDDDTAGGFPSEIELVASSEESVEFISERLAEGGTSVRSSSVWQGPMPPGSVATLADGMRMSTPEYFFLRKVNQLPFLEAVWLGIELCGKFRTVRTQHMRDEGYDFLRRPRTTKARLRSYLRGARGTKEGKRAKRVLRLIAEECCSPMGCYLYLLLCLPRSHGSYGLAQAQLSAAFDKGCGYLPSSSGPYMAYDLCWMDKSVALQYTGPERPTMAELEALRTDGMRVVCVTDAEVADPERFDGVARKVARLLGTSLPDDTDKWRRGRARLREQMVMPDYAHMRLTMDDICEHRLV